jgi:hypothetical protein
VKIPESLIDDLPDDSDLPYLEMLYKFVFQRSLITIYNLLVMSNLEGRRRRASRSRRTQPVGEHGRARSERRWEGPHWRACPQHGRKTTLANPTSYSCSGSERIRRWDGYLCVLHL